MVALTIYNQHYNNDNNLELVTTDDYMKRKDVSNSVTIVTTVFGFLPVSPLPKFSIVFHRVRKHAPCLYKRVTTCVISVGSWDALPSKLTKHEG